MPDTVIEKIVNSIKVRDATRKARQIVRRKGLLDTTLPGKLSDCSESDPEKCELFLVEGDSAGGCHFFNTKIITEKGIKQIGEVKIGDKVLTHKGNYKKVKDIFTTYKKKRAIMTISEKKMKVISADHPYLIQRMNYQQFSKLMRV